jgi:hypothetical protein
LTLLIETNGAPAILSYSTTWGGADFHQTKTHSGGRDARIGRAPASKGKALAAWNNMVDQGRIT